MHRSNRDGLAIDVQQVPIVSGNFKASELSELKDRFHFFHDDRDIAINVIDGILSTYGKIKIDFLLVLKQEETIIISATSDFPAMNSSYIG